MSSTFRSPGVATGDTPAWRCQSGGDLHRWIPGNIIYVFIWAICGQTGKL